MMNSSSLNWVVIENKLVQHFTSAERLATIRDISKFPNFFESWFTAECLSAILRSFPAIKARTNENFPPFGKPDITLSYDGFVCVIEVKHISTHSNQCCGRWDGDKGSTVAKDIFNLQRNVKTNIVKIVTVFYGPVEQAAHNSNKTCGLRRELCLECNLNHLQNTLACKWKSTMPVPNRIRLLSDSQGDFYLLVFAI